MDDQRYQTNGHDQFTVYLPLENCKFAQPLSLLPVTFHYNYSCNYGNQPRNYSDTPKTWVRILTVQGHSLNYDIPQILPS